MTKELFKRRLSQFFDVDLTTVPDWALIDVFDDAGIEYFFTFDEAKKYIVSFYYPLAIRDNLLDYINADKFILELVADGEIFIFSGRIDSPLYVVVLDAELEFVKERLEEAVDRREWENEE